MKARTTALHRRPIYLDYAATTPVAPEVVDAMSSCLGLDGLFGNPASRSHLFGQEASEAVERARAQVAKLIGADPYQIVWTSGATEAINLALKGVAHAADGHHIVTSALEHHAVLDTCARLARDGFEITYVKPDARGLVTRDRVQRALRSDTVLVSVMHVNNEVGTITDIGAISELTRDEGVALHVDAAQSAARLHIDVSDIAVDLLSLSGHKMYGPKGVGALYARTPWRVEPQMHGGDQENGLRSGTLATHQVVGMGRAAELVGSHHAEEHEEVALMDRRLVERLAAIPGACLTGNPDRRVPGIMNLAFEGVDSEALMIALREELAVSSGSACTSSRIETSHVLKALNVADDLAECTIRFSLGRFTTPDEIDLAATRVERAVWELRRLARSEVYARVAP